MKDLTALLEALDAKRRAATPGPYRWRGGYDFLIGGDLHCIHTPRQNEDACYLAALDPDTVGALIDCVRAAAHLRDAWVRDRPTEIPMCGLDDALAALAARLGGR